MRLHKIPVDYISPLGTLRIHFIEGLIDRVDLKPLIPSPHPSAQTLPKSIHRYLDNYFAKRPTPIKPYWFRPRQSRFANTIYAALQDIKFGTQITYGDLAIKAGYNAHYARAVGQAMNKNPWPLFVPCHRVVGNKGGLGGFAAGIDLKRSLLEHEGYNSNHTLPFDTTILSFHQKVRNVS